MNKADIHERIKLVCDILERVNRDPELVSEIRERPDLDWPDLQVAMFVAQGLRGEPELQP